MSNEQRERTDKPKTKRLNDLGPEYDILLARHRGETCTPAVVELAENSVIASVRDMAGGLICLRFGEKIDWLADDATADLWMFMAKKNGGFARYDRDRPFAAYLIGTLIRICFGRDILLAKIDFRRRTVRDSNDPQRDPELNKVRKPKLVQRQMPRGFDVPDHGFDRSVRQLEAREIVDQVLAHLTDEQRDLLFLSYGLEVNLAELARDRNVNVNTIYTQVNRAFDKAFARRGEFEQQ